MEKLHPGAVIFDLGSTLIEYEAVPWNEMNVTCAASARQFLVDEGLEVPDDEAFYREYETIKDEFRARAMESLVEWTVIEAAEAMFRRWQIETDDGLVDRFFDAYYQPITDKIFTYNDTLNVLRRVRRTYGVIGLISNTVFPERAHRAELHRFGIWPYLDFTLFSSTFGLRKPHPDIFCKGAALAGFPPAECVYIGDRYIEDVEGPQRVGMPAILKLWDRREYPDDVDRRVRTIRGLSDLEQHLALAD